MTLANGHQLWADTQAAAHEAEWRALENERTVELGGRPASVPCRPGQRHNFEPLASLLSRLDDERDKQGQLAYQRAEQSERRRGVAWYEHNSRAGRMFAKLLGGKSRGDVERQAYICRCCHVVIRVQPKPVTFRAPGYGLTPAQEKRIWAHRPITLQPQGGAHEANQRALREYAGMPANNRFIEKYHKTAALLAQHSIRLGCNA